MARQPKEIDDEEMIRDYLRRQIADINKSISGKARDLDNYSSVFRDIVESFANPNDNKITDVLQDIYDDMKKHKSFAVYNYFDLDTLFSYLQYLKLILSGLDNSRREYGRYKCNGDDFDKAILNGCRWLKKYKGKKESGYYSVKNPIKVLKNNYGKFEPEKTRTPDDFKKRYNVDECDNALESYLDDREESMMSRPILLYGNKEYEIINFDRSKDNHYYSLNEESVNHFIAENIKEGVTLNGYFYHGREVPGKDNVFAYDVFYGDLYDKEGNSIRAEDTELERYVKGGKGRER